MYKGGHPSCLVLPDVIKQAAYSTGLVHIGASTHESIEDIFAVVEGSDVDSRAPILRR